MAKESMNPTKEKSEVDNSDRKRAMYYYRSDELATEFVQNTLCPRKNEEDDESVELFNASSTEARGEELSRNEGDHSGSSESDYMELDYADDSDSGDSDGSEDDSFDDNDDDDDGGGEIEGSDEGDEENWTTATDSSAGSENSQTASTPRSVALISVRTASASGPVENGSDLDVAAMDTEAENEEASVEHESRTFDRSFVEGDCVSTAKLFGARESSEAAVMLTTVGETDHSPTTSDNITVCNPAANTLPDGSVCNENTSNGLRVSLAQKIATLVTNDAVGVILDENLALEMIIMNNVLALYVQEREYGRAKIHCASVERFIKVRTRWP
jgi:hypothetical protein